MGYRQTNVTRFENHAVRRLASLVNQQLIKLLRSADVFVKYQSLMGLQLYPRRVYERILKDPLVDPDAYHPALLNAVALVACSCGGERMQRFEDIFLTRTRDFCAEALAYAQQLDDFMTASALQCAYLVRSGRMREAYTLASSESLDFLPPVLPTSLTDIYPSAQQLRSRI